MSVRTYKQIIEQAKKCKWNVEHNYSLGISTKWSYYFAKQIVSPRKDVTRKTNLGTAPKPRGDYVSRQIPKEDYKRLARRFLAFCEKHNRLPNYITHNDVRIRCRLYVYMFARILVYYDAKQYFPHNVNVNYKVFYPPKETHNVVYDYYNKRTGEKPKTVDEVLEYMDGKGYGAYSDDKLSNKQVIDGLVDNDDDLDANCTDALQFLINMAENMGYSWKCIHVECRVSGTGHVFGKFKHPVHTGGEWIIRDPASVLDGNGIRSVWCENGWLLAENPSWFLENLHK